MKEMLSQQKFYMPNVNPKAMKAKGFKKRSYFIEGQLYRDYSYKFPVLYWNNEPTLMCVLYVNADNGSVRIDVLSNNNTYYKSYYTPFYCDSGSVWDDINNKIEKQILNKFKKLGIKKKKSKYNNTIKVIK